MDWLFIAMVFAAGSVCGATVGVVLMCVVSVGARRV